SVTGHLTGCPARGSQSGREGGDDAGGLRRRARNPRAGHPVRWPVTLQRVESSALHQWERIAGKPGDAATRGGRPWRAWLLQVTRLAAWALLVASLPFLALVKVAVVLCERGGYPTT